MRIVIILAATIALLTSCSGTEAIDDQELNNERIMGTVVSIKRTSETNWEGAGNVARSSGAVIGNVATGGLFSNWWNTSGPSSSDVSSTTGVAYVIETEEGKRITVMGNDSRVYYPGDEVMVVRNSNGYANVYPRNLSQRHPGGL